MKKLLLLGSSGSIGTQCIDVVRSHKDELSLFAVSVGHNVDYLRGLLKEFDSIKYAYAIDADADLTNEFPDVEFHFGDQGLIELTELDGYDMLVNALVGFVGLMPTIKALEKSKDVALANKESLVAGGELIKDLIKKNNNHLYPIDSEHSAITQSLAGNDKMDIRRLILTASGGAFRDKTRDELKNVTLKDALNHPNWKMGKKITIDSATMMNKGFEVIEAHYLFDVAYDDIDVLIHDESIIHSMVEYKDGSIINQIGTPDMHLPIKYALLGGKHIEDNNTNLLDFSKVSSLHFKEIDYKRFPLVRLAKQVGSIKGNYGAILIGANDEAVDLFMLKRCKFIDIEKLIFKTFEEAAYKAHPTCEDLINSNRWAREKVDEIWANS